MSQTTFSVEILETEIRRSPVRERDSVNKAMSCLKGHGDVGLPSLLADFMLRMQHSPNFVLKCISNVSERSCCDRKKLGRRSKLSKSV